MDKYRNEGEASARLASLMSRSPTRRRIIELLVAGKPRKVIASVMKRSQHTIDSHIKAIYRAIGVGDRGQLMVLASRLLPPPELGTADLSKHVEGESHDSDTLRQKPEHDVAS